MIDGFKLQVWWIPQIPGNPFLVDVPDLDTAILLCDALANYDLFQFDNNIKPDYCNAGGIRAMHPTLTDGAWEDLDYEDEYELEYARQLLETGER